MDESHVTKITLGQLWLFVKSAQVMLPLNLGPPSNVACENLKFKCLKNVQKQRKQQANRKDCKYVKYTKHNLRHRFCGLLFIYGEYTYTLSFCQVFLRLNTQGHWSLVHPPPLLFSISLSSVSFISAFCHYHLAADHQRKHLEFSVLFHFVFSLLSSRERREQRP